MFVHTTWYSLLTFAVINRPWVKKVGPYDHAPQKPEPSQTLKYFSAREGLEALSNDAVLQPGTTITRSSLPPAQPVQPASAGEPHCGTEFHAILQKPTWSIL